MSIQDSCLFLFSPMAIWQWRIPFSFFSLHLCVGLYIHELMELAEERTQNQNQDEGGSFSDGYRVVYVLGGPGSGKGTQCSKIAQHFGFCHLTVGDLLQAEVESGSQHGKLIEDLKKKGELVPSELVVTLLQQAMQRSKNKMFLIDGFPRNEENRVLAEKSLRIEPEFVLFLDCSEEEMTRRILNRNQGRVDDNIDTIRQRFRVYHESTIPVIGYYVAKGKVRRIDAERSIDEVFESIKSVFTNEFGSNVNALQE